MGTGGQKTKSKRRRALLFLDSAVILGVWGAVLVASNITSTQHRSDSASLALWLFVSSFTVLSFVRRDLYQIPQLPRTDEISRLISLVLVGSAALATAASFGDANLGAWELVLGSTSGVVLLVIGRGLLHRYQGLNLPAAARVVVVGAGEEAVEVVELIRDHPESGIEFVGVVGSRTIADEHNLQDVWIGPTERLLEYMTLHQASGAIVTPTGFRGSQFRLINRTLFDAGFDVHLSTGVNRIWTGRFDVRTLSHEPLIKLSHQRKLPFEQALKRALDIVGASIAIILAAPIMVAAAVAIRLSDGGPVLFRQRRAGRDTEYFDMLKFRSMVIDAEERKSELAGHNERNGPLFKISHDPRITKVGRFIRESSIDELPQLFNVLRGDMSLVGPRPALREEEAEFDVEFRDRFAVRPGITGLWQVEARSNASYAAYRRLDLHYVENWSLGLDLRILMATAAYVVVSLIASPFQRFFAKADAISEPAPGHVVIDIRASQPRLKTASPDSNTLNKSGTSRATPKEQESASAERIVGQR